MRVLLSWLKEYVDIPYTVDELEDLLPALGLGIDAVERAGDDAVFDLETAANRGDLMSVVGIARELAAAARTAVRMPQAELRPDPAAVEAFTSVEVTAPDLCPRFTAAMIVDVRVGPSPDWLVRRLEACGVRSINNIVDVTNYVMLELGHPMHAFDYDRIAGGRLVVRLARPGEALTTLDGVTRTLDPQTLVVADARQAAGIAGIIGGAPSEISLTTRRVLLEAAVWHPPTIRRTSRRLGVRTESSARFERGVDPEGVAAASARALALMAALSGGRVLSGLIDVRAVRPRPRQVALRWPSVARLLGVEIPQDDGIAILRSLGFGVERTDRGLTVAVPSFRQDVEREEDLIEEVARHYGYDRIPETMPVEATAQGGWAPELQVERAIREAMVRAGLTEALTVSLTHPGALDALDLPPDHPLRRAAPIQNPLIEDHVQLRTTLLPGLLHAARVNASHRVSDVQLFELGRTFAARDGAVVEHRRLGVVMMGRVLDGAWNLPAELVEVSYYHLKGALEALLEALRIDGAVFEPAAAPWLQPGQAAQVRLGADVLGTLGRLHPQVAARFDLSLPVYVAELDAEALIRRAVLIPRFVALPRFPAVRRDLSLIVPDDVTAGRVAAVIAAAGGALLERAEVFDVYTGPPVPPGHRNLAYTLSFRAPDRTLTADEVAAVLARITDALQTTVGARIRA